MKNLRLLSTTAAVLLLGAGIASAQSMKKDEAPGRAPAAQQTAPAEKVAPTMKTGEQKAGAQQKAPETTGQAPKPSDADKPRATDKGAMEKGATEKGAVNKGAMDKGAEKNGDANVKPKTNAAEGAAGSKSSQSTAEQKKGTTGQGAAAGSAKLSTEQRTKITSVIKKQNVQSTHLNVTINIGTRVPADVHYYPLPTEVITIYPEWRGYDYILVDGRIVIIEPSSHEIVFIIES